MLDAALFILLAQVALLVFIAAVDIKTRRIHRGALLALTGVALVRAFSRDEPALPAAMVSAACGGGAFWLAYWGGRLYGKLALLPRHVGVFGLGDVYLMAAAGLCVGFPDILLTMALTICLGGVGAGMVLLAAAVAGHGDQRNIAMPYAPFITFATIAVMLSPLDFLHLLYG